MLQGFLPYCADCQGKISTCFWLTDQAAQAGKQSTWEAFAQEEHYSGFLSSPQKPAFEKFTAI